MTAMQFSPAVFAILLSLLQAPYGFLVFSPVNLTVDDTRGSTNFAIALSAPPANNAPVYVYMDSVNQLHMNPCRLMFTPNNYYIPQNVSVIGIPAVISYEPAFHLPLKTWNPSPSGDYQNRYPSNNHPYYGNPYSNPNGDGSNSNPYPGNGYPYGNPNGEGNNNPLGNPNYEGSNGNPIGYPEVKSNPFGSNGSPYNTGYPYGNPNENPNGVGSNNPNGSNGYPYGIPSGNINPFGQNGNPNSQNPYGPKENPNENPYDNGNPYHQYPYGPTKNPIGNNPYGNGNPNVNGNPYSLNGFPNSNPNGQNAYPYDPYGNPNGENGFPTGQKGKGTPLGAGSPNSQYPNSYPNDQNGYPNEQNGYPNGQNGYPGQNGNPGQNGFPIGQNGYPNGAQPFNYHNQNFLYPTTRQAGPAVGGNAIGDPHLTTYDGARYDFQGKGTYYYALSVDGQVVIQGHHFPCGGGATCLDSVAVKYQNFVAITAINHTSNTATVSTNFDPSQFHIKMVKNDAASTHSFEFPDGSTIEVNGYQLFVKFSSIYRYRVKGLLGTFDNDTNPYTQLKFDGTEANIATPAGIQAFGMSYAVPENLVLTTTYEVPQPAETGFPFLDDYAMNGPANVCQIPTPQLFETEPLPSGIQNRCTHCNEPIRPFIGAPAQMLYEEPQYSPYSSSPLEQQQPEVIPNEATASQNPNPMSSVAEQVAKQACQNNFKNQQCNQLLGADVINIYVNNCYLDVTCMGTLKPSDAARIAYTRQCNTILQANALRQGTISPTEKFTSATCNPQDPNACSGNGICVASGCRCYGAFTGSKCSISDTAFQTNPSQILQHMQTFSNSLSNSINGEIQQTFRNINSQLKKR